jgi:hypothetical protein
MSGRRIGQRAVAWGPYVPVEGYGAVRAVFCSWVRAHDGKPPRDEDTLGKWLRGGTRLPVCPSEPGSSSHSWRNADYRGQLVCHENSLVAWANQCLAIVTSSKQAQAAIARAGIPSGPRRDDGSEPDGGEGNRNPGPSNSKPIPRTPTGQALPFVAAVPCADEPRPPPIAFLVQD